MTPEITIAVLDQWDQEAEPAVREWLDEFLVDHIAYWNRMAGRGASVDDVSAHIGLHKLVERELNEMKNAAADPERFIALARSGAQACGIVYAESRPERYLMERIGVLSWVYVAPSQRECGIGGRLIGAAGTWMNSRELHLREVFVSDHNQAAIKLYRRAGFRQTDVRLTRGITR